MDEDELRARAERYRQLALRVVDTNAAKALNDLAHEHDRAANTVAKAVRLSASVRA